uniref:Uncharacterized protein LOC113787691 n=1 Tax=Cicer arietinum TaxID=3827 RepID=A0A3Q7XVN2_CICAR|nr:uncharacterized protein LOC113787691 [Cicer arietinum]
MIRPVKKAHNHKVSFIKFFIRPHILSPFNESFSVAPTHFFLVFCGLGPKGLMAPFSVFIFTTEHKSESPFTHGTDETLNQSSAFYFFLRSFGFDHRHGGFSFSSPLICVQATIIVDFMKSFTHQNEDEYNAYICEDALNTTIIDSRGVWMGKRYFVSIGFIC